MLEALLDALLDTGKLLPILFLTYLFMEYLEPEIIMLLLGYFLREAVRGGKRHRKSRETCGDFARQ